MFLYFCSAVWGAVGATACAPGGAGSATTFAASDCTLGPSAALSKPELMQIAPRTRARMTAGAILVILTRFFKSYIVVPPRPRSAGNFGGPIISGPERHSQTSAGALIR